MCVHPRTLLEGSKQNKYYILGTNACQKVSDHCSETGQPFKALMNLLKRYVLKGLPASTLLILIMFVP